MTESEKKKEKQLLSLILLSIIACLLIYGIYFICNTVFSGQTQKFGEINTEQILSLGSKFGTNLVT